MTPTAASTTPFVTPAGICSSTYGYLIDLLSAHARGHPARLLS